MDDGPLGQLSRFVNAGDVANWPPGKLLVASSTRHQARISPDRMSLLEATNEQGQTVFETFQVTLGGGDPAETVFLGLHPDEATTTDLAEHEAIAWALVHGRDSVFVTVDKRASLTALAELGRGRVSHAFDLWLELLDAGLLSQGQFAGVCEADFKKDTGLKRMPGRVRERIGDLGGV